MQNLYRLQLKDTGTASGVLNKAFYDYPDFAYIFPDEDERSINLQYVIRFLIKCGILHGEVLAPSNNFEGISIWYNSSELAFSFKDIIRAGLFNLLFKLNKGSFDKFRELGESKKANRNETITGGYYFLDMIGVDPPCQNQGYAKIMIETKLEIIDENKMPCYLETSNIANADYYTKYGFHIIDENNFHGIKTYSLYRESKNK